MHLAIYQSFQNVISYAYVYIDIEFLFKQFNTVLYKKQLNPFLTILVILIMKAVILFYLAVISAHSEMFPMTSSTKMYKRIPLPMPEQVLELLIKALNSNPDHFGFLFTRPYGYDNVATYYSQTYICSTFKYYLK